MKYLKVDYELAGRRVEHDGLTHWTVYACAYHTGHELLIYGETVAYPDERLRGVTFKETTGRHYCSVCATKIGIPA